MPEMPEVEGLARFLDERVSGRTIERVRVHSVSALKTFDPPIEALEGREIVAATRYGKQLGIATRGPTGDGLHLIVHLALAGWLRWYDALPATPVKPGGYINLRVRLDDADGFDLTEAGTKHSLAVYVVRDPRDVPGVARLGPDALEIDLATFTALLTGRRTAIKNLLRDQSIIGGIGNAYSDELLHVARLSPFKPAANLTPAEIAGLHAAMVETLGTAITAAAGRPPAELKDAKRSAMRVHGRDGEPCPVCGDRVRSVKYADRTFQYCPTCQTGGKPLADRVLSRLLK